MARFTVEELLIATGGRLLSASRTSRRAFSLSVDSRTASSGDFFVAIEGRSFDGHNFVSSVFKKGAAGALVRQGFRASRTMQRDSVLIAVDDTVRAFQDIASFHRKRFDIPVVAVSGSNGKTTTTQMIATILRQEHSLLETKGNFNNHIGLPLTLLRLTHRHKMAVIEMGVNHFGELKQLCRIAKPTFGVLTNIGLAHLEGFKHIDGVAKAKGELISSLPANGTAILNADDEFFEFLSSLAKSKVVTFGFSPYAEVRATRMKADGFSGSTFSLCRPGFRRPMRLSLNVLGEHNVANAAAASAVGIAMGVKAISIRDGLKKFSPISMRTEIVEWGGVKFLNDTYNANPTSVKAALEALCRLRVSGKRIAVLGDMLELGKKSKAAHREVGMLVATLDVDELIVCGSMGPEIAMGALKAGMSKSIVFVTDDKDTLYPILTACLAERVVSGDVVLVKGSRAMRLEGVLEWWKEQFSKETNLVRS